MISENPERKGRARTSLRPFVLALLAVTLPHPSSLACTTVMAEKNGLVLAGHNEDLDKYNHRINFLPGSDRLYGCFYTSWGRDWPINGMNDQGLFLGDNSISGTGWKADDGKADFPGNSRLHILQTCATVSDVKKFFETYNVSLLKDLHFPVADRSGARMVVECANGKVNFIVEDTWYQISTNFLRTQYPGKEVPCGRFKSARETFEATQELSPALVRSILSATHQEGSAFTIYSCIFDLKARTIDLYFKHNFDKPLSFNLADEIQKGPHSLEMAAPFSAKKP